MYVAADTAPGSADHPNEDYLAATSDLLVVLDGATVRTDTGCHHSVSWYVRKLGAAIIAAAAQRSTPLAEVLAIAIRQVAELHPECDLTHPGTPSAAVAIVRSEDIAVRYLVLGDVSVVVDTGDQPLVISDERVSMTGAAERARADQWPIGSAEKADALIAMKQAELAARNRDGGYWIAAADPSVVAQAITDEIPHGLLRRLAVLTDGAARSVVLFKRHTWSTALDALTRSGPAELIRQVRLAEDADRLGTAFPRNKLSDDATVVFARPEPIERQPAPEIEAKPGYSLIETIANSGRLFGACPTSDGRIL